MVIDDSEIEQVFDGTNFGSCTDYRKILRQGVLKTVAGYHSGRTLTMIMQGLFLIDNESKITNKGRMFLWESFREDL